MDRYRFFLLFRQSIHTLKSGEKLSAEVETESDDTREADFVWAEWSDWEVEALKREIQHCQNGAQDCSEPTSKATHLQLYQAIFPGFHPFHSQLFSPQQWFQRTCSAFHNYGSQKHTQFITRSQLRPSQHCHERKPDQILNQRNEGAPFQAFRWEKLAHCNLMKTDRILNASQHNSNRSFTMVEWIQNRNLFPPHGTFLSQV